MNLIEQLGGYERAKYFKENVAMTSNKRNSLEAELLEHRRANNIFEVGDRVVLKRDDQFTDIYTYDNYSEKLDLHFFESENDYGHITLDKVRHATPEEIKAGKRL